MGADNPTQPLPCLNESGSFYWQSGKSGQFSLGWCSNCQTWLHPARLICPDCTQTATPKNASGLATLVSYTVNHQPWLKSFEAPYIIAIVSPAEAPSIQLTSNLIDVEEHQISIGMTLEVTFKEHDGIWLPLFKPARVTSSEEAKPLPKFEFISPSVKYESAVVFTGIGKSSIGRNLPQSQNSLTTEACLKAISDSGLLPNEIDGICAYPGSSGLPGLSDGGVRELAYNLNLKPVWHMGAQETPGQAGSLTGAMLAIAAGLCKNVVCFTSFATVAKPLPKNQGKRITGEPRWSLPFGCVSPANWIAMYARRYMQHYQVDEQLLGTLAIAQRNNAQLNPNALYKESLDMTTYLNSRRISTPFKLLDCDTPCDGAIAFVLSHVDSAQNKPEKSVYIEACGTAFSEVQSWDQGTVLYQPNVLSASQHLWSRTDFTAKDVDIAQLYDGFTFNAICWIETLGFCEPGGAADFIGDGSILSTKGGFPLNTHGGHLNTGRTNGYGHIYEAIEQLRGYAGKRQVKGAKVAAVSTGGGIPACAMLLKTAP